MAKIAPVPIFAMVVPLVISALFCFQNWLADVQVVQPMSEEAELAVPAVAVLHIGPAQLDLPLVASPARGA